LWLERYERSPLVMKRNSQMMAASSRVNGSESVAKRSSKVEMSSSGMGGSMTGGYIVGITD
jgi:hypothetical protein